MAVMNNEKLFYYASFVGVVYIVTQGLLQLMAQNGTYDDGSSFLSYIDTQSMNRLIEQGNYYQNTDWAQVQNNTTNMSGNVSFNNTSEETEAWFGQDIVTMTQLLGGKIFQGFKILLNQGQCQVQLMVYPITFQFMLFGLAVPPQLIEIVTQPIQLIFDVMLIRMAISFIKGTL